MPISWHQLTGQRIDIGDAILNASQPAFTDPASILSPLTPVTLLSERLMRPERELSINGMPLPLLDLLRHVHETTLRFESQMLEDQLRTSSKTGSRARVLRRMSEIFSEDELLSFSETTGNDSFYVACRCAANIHLKSMGQVIPYSSDGNQKLVKQLGLALSQTSKSMWHETEPEIYIWLCFTGAAADQEGKTWFLAKAGPVVMSLKPDELQKFKTGVLRFCQLLQYLEELDL